ncbi:hypothetical protein R3F64_09470 [Halomonas sp. 5021]|uniref:hypothetical protein n=1 Tax=Halomonas sp. 5021 TaxID=3082156 RepID=UPI002FC5B1A4
MVRVVKGSGRVVAGEATTRAVATVRSADSVVEIGPDGRAKRATTGEFLSAARRAGEDTKRFIKAQRKELLEEKF